MDPLSIFFILYHPAVAGNIGASARAMKTMGFGNLRLVNPVDHLAVEARMLAHGSIDILERAEVFGTFADAVADLDFIIVTTANTSRTSKQDFISSREISSILKKKGMHASRVGIVFGCEESGLPNRIVLGANLAVTIPMAGPYPSLNLSQSVMVMAYELARITGQNKEAAPDAKTDPQSWSALETRVISILNRSGIPGGSPLHHRILERMSLLGAEDINLVHSVSSRVAQRLGPEE